LTQETRAFDGVNWICAKCGVLFNLIQANDYRCPNCSRQVSLKEVRRKPIDYTCIFQTLKTDPRFLGLGCQLTARGIGAGDGTSGSEDYSKCNPTRCPIHQTWNILKHQQSLR